MTGQLSPRETHVVGLVVMGCSNKEIGYALRLTEGTVKVYLSRIFHKLHVVNRKQLVLWAIHRLQAAAPSAL